MTPAVVALLVVLVASLVALAFPVLAYPVVLAIAVRFVPPPPRRSADEELPTVTLIIAAYNEEAVIADKIENSFELDYPDDKLEIVVFSDASSDRTDEIVRSYADAGVELMRIEGRVGKTECQNQVAAAVDGDVLVFSDANSMYEPDAIRRLVDRFADDVGCVVGELRHTRTDEDVAGETLFWRYNRLVKRLESRISSVVKGNGAIYAVRNEDYVPLPSDEISDFAEPLAVKACGRAVQYAHDAVALERTAGSVDAEQARKVRIVTRSWHTMWRYLGLLNPFEHGAYSFMLFTDTVLWWIMPLLVAATLASSAALFALTGHPLFALVVAGFVLLGALGALGYYLERRGRSVPFVFHLPHYFLVGNYSLVVGGWNFLRGRNIVTWETAND